MVQVSNSGLQAGGPNHLAATEVYFARDPGRNAVGIQCTWIKFQFESFDWTVSVEVPGAAKWLK